MNKRKKVNKHNSLIIVLLKNQILYYCITESPMNQKVLEKIPSKSIVDRPTDSSNYKGSLLLTSIAL